MSWEDTIGCYFLLGKKDTIHYCEKIDVKDWVQISVYKKNYGWNQKITDVIHEKVTIISKENNPCLFL